MHKHHKIPRHMGGTDDPTNIYECSVEEHAELHLALYLEHGHWQDWYAAMGLAGIIGKEEIVREQNSRAGKKNIGRKRPDFVEYLQGEGRKHHGGGRNKGVARTDDEKKAISEGRKGIPTKPEDNKRRSEALKKY